MAPEKFAFPNLLFPHLLRDVSKDRTDYPITLVGQIVKNLPAMRETQVQSLGQEDPLEKGMAAHSSILFLPGEFHEERSLEGYRPWVARSPVTERLHFDFTLSKQILPFSGYFY